ncbi:MAG TPA: hypothetical protein PKN48_00570 [Bacteroidales bacterium]|nr:hypothetical protein [Bacteroidales bacterium]
MIDHTIRVHIKEVSSQGHTDYDFDLDEALEHITEATKNGKWLYINNEFKSPNDITIEDLAAAQDLVLTNGLVGGN